MDEYPGNLFGVLRGEGEKTKIVRGFWRENRGHFTQSLGHHGRS
jgi:hypothetical protein